MRKGPSFVMMIIGTSVFCFGLLMLLVSGLMNTGLVDVIMSVLVCIVGAIMFTIAFIIYSLHKKNNPGGTVVSASNSAHSNLSSVQNLNSNSESVVSSLSNSSPGVFAQGTSPDKISTVSTNSINDNNNNDVKRRYNEFLITDKYIKYKNIEYPYSSICNLVLLWNASASSHGAIELWGPSMKRPLQMQFNMFETDALVRDLEYANNQIDKAHGRQKHYKYCLQSDLDTRVEVYDDYIIAYTLNRGFMQSFRNAASGGIFERLVKFSDLSVLLYDNPKHVQFTLDGKKLDVRLTVKNYQNAIEAVEYITRIQASPIVEEINVEAINEKWQPSVGVQREFQLEDKKLVITAEMDQFNSYMLRFRYLASLCANELIAESRRKIHDLQTYVRFFPFIYDKYLDVLISKAIDILVAEGVWNVTHEQLKDAHYDEVGNLSVDDMAVTINSIVATIEANQSHPLTTILGVIPQVYDKLSQITAMQQNELFERIDFDVLYHHVFRDYALVFASMAAVLRNNGKDIWFPSSDDVNNAKNVFQNISHPNFPDDKRIDAFFNIITTDPYQMEYYQFLLKQWGENEQTTTIKNYFGFLDFNNPRMCITR